MNYKELHDQGHPLLMANVWDVPSTRLAQELNFQAIGTSSSAIASLLGYQDGEEMSFDELEYIVSRISSCTKVPLSVDLEGGYSRDPMVIVRHIKRLADLGVVGVNIEDSIVDNDRKIIDAEAFAQLLHTVKKGLIDADINMFVNVRTDTFLLQMPNAIEETYKRIKLYEASGADGIFIPCIENDEDIEKLVRFTTLPINVMCMPYLSDFDKLCKLGVRRISMGNFVFDNMYAQYQDTMENVLNKKSFKPLF